jgi:hypothetical protein
MMPLLHAEPRSAGNGLKGMAFMPVHIAADATTFGDFKVTGAPKALPSVEFMRTAHHNA